jgi:hypothetical protein
MRQDTHMADLPDQDDTRVDPDHEATIGTPRWVKVFGIIAAVVVILFIILMLTRGPGGRGHTPFRHFGGEAPPEGGRR